MRLALLIPLFVRQIHSSRRMQLIQPEMQKIQRNGTTFHVQTKSDVSMVMTQRGDHWYCLMGQLPTDRLITFWDSLAK